MTVYMLKDEAKGRGFAMLYCDESEQLATALNVSTWLQDQVYTIIEEVRNGRS